MTRSASHIARDAHNPVAPELLERLRAVCGAEHVLTQPIQLRTYESDGLLQYRATPGAVVLPGSAAEVRDVVRACSDPSGGAPTPRLCGEVPGPYRAHPLERDGIVERF